jgi:hypothetical protein
MCSVLFCCLRLLEWLVPIQHPSPEYQHFLEFSGAQIEYIWDPCSCSCRPKDHGSAVPVDTGVLNGTRTLP